MSMPKTQLRRHFMISILAYRLLIRPCSDLS